MSPGTNGNDPPSWAALGNGNGDGLPRGAANSNGNGAAQGTSDRSNPPPPAKPPGGASLYGRLQEGMGFADPRVEALDAVRVRVHRRVISELGPVFYNNLVDQKELRLAGRADRSGPRCGPRRRPCQRPRRPRWPRAWATTSLATGRSSGS